jgi:hypothetical protein
MFRNIAVVCISRNVVMTEQSILNWKSNFLSLESVQRYLIVEKENKVEEYCEMSAVECLAKLMMDPIEDDNDVRRGTLFRWEPRSQCVIPPPCNLEAVAACSKDPSLWIHGIFFGIKYEYGWIDWLYYSSSTVDSVEVYGLYAAQDFKVNQVIGFYMGRIVWQGDVEGGGKPSIEELAACNVSMNDHCVFVHDKNCRMVIIDGSDRNQFRMGIQFVRKTNDEAKVNVTLAEDGSLRCLCNISEFSELLLFEEGSNDTKPPAKIYDKLSRKRQSSEDQSLNKAMEIDKK